MSDLVGQQIGAYLIDRLLGAGGMGAVYAGHNIHSQQQVAIKVMRDSVVQPNFRQRFLQEGQAIAQLDHPNIVKIFHFDEHAGNPYLVMELVNSGNLRGLLQRYAGVGRLPPLPVALSLALQAAQALAYAHARGVIHRDVKPDNMLLQREADPSSGPARFILKLTDFGLARLVQGVALTTVSGTIMGTPQYMSPEQCQGLPVDARTDIYALGVVLYELTTGYTPFSGPTPEVILEKQVKTPPVPPRQQRPQLPPEVEQIILRCMEKDAASRFATADELANALQRVLQQPEFASHYSVQQQPRIATPVPTLLADAAPAPPTQPAPPAPTPPATSGGGQLVGHYQVETALPLGGGGMGQVFRARDTRDGRLVALKLVYANLAADPKVRQRFFHREAQIGQALHHPNIVEVYEAGEDRGQLFLAMELLEDGSLRTLLERRASQPWPLRIGLDLVRQAAEGLAAAHAHGIVHRDIKPDNLLLRRRSAAAVGAGAMGADALLSGLLAQTSVSAPPATEGYDLKVSDFGVATLVEGTRMTSTGVQVGTHAYMSPEQCTGKPVDPRSDIYALGVVLYEIATGVLPFQIDNPSAAMYQILFTSPPPPRTLNPALPADIEAIILRCMAREPDGRFATAAELAAALRQAIGAMDTGVSRMVAPAPQPTTFMRGAEHIYVALDRSTLSITPGQPASLTVTVRNLSARTDHFAISIAGAPAGWVTPAVEALQLNPSAGDSVNFTILVPRRPESRAGEYDITVRAESQTVTPGDAGLARARWTVEEFAGNDMEIEPRIAVGRDAARYKLQVRNDGNARARYTLRGVDDLGVLQYAFRQGGQALSEDRPVAVEPDAEVQIGLVASAPRKLFGSVQSHNIGVELKGGSQPRTERVRFDQRPLIPTWLVSVLVPLLLLLCVGGSTYGYSAFVLQPTALAATATAQSAAGVATAQAQGIGTATFVAEQTAAAVAAATATASWVPADDDRDGLKNGDEIRLGTLPSVRDTDGDGLDDGDEVAKKTDPLKPDTDGDGLKDGEEIAKGTDPLKPDTDGDGLKDNVDPDPIHPPTEVPTNTPVPPTNTPVPPTDTPTIPLPTDTPTIPLPTDTPTIPLPTDTPTPIPLGYSIDHFIGNWVNVDPNTGGLKRLVIERVDDQTVRFNGYGACGGGECDWSAMVGGGPLVPFTPPQLVGTYRFSFVVTRITAERSGDQLKVTTFDHFIDSSGRPDQTDTYMMAQNAPFIRLVYPKGGECWARNQVYKIRWESNVKSNVKITLKGPPFDGPGGLFSIADNIPNNGEFDYTIPSNYGYDSFRITVMTLDGSVKGSSEISSPLSGGCP